MRNKKLISIFAVTITSLILGFIFSFKYLNSKAEEKKDSPTVTSQKEITQLYYKIDLKTVADKDKEDTTKEIVEIINQRLQTLDFSEPKVYQKEIDQEKHIVVELTKSKDLEKAPTLIPPPIKLEFKEQINPNLYISKEPIAPWKATDLTKKQLIKAEINNASSFNPTPTLKVTFNEEGTTLFQEITKRNINKPIGIFINDELISAPIVKTEITGGEAIITGQFDLKEAQELASQLNAGTIPSTITLADIKVIKVPTKKD